MIIGNAFRTAIPALPPSFQDHEDLEAVCLKDAVDISGQTPRFVATITERY
jgi:hypothetical protein